MSFLTSVIGGWIAKRGVKLMLKKLLKLDVVAGKKTYMLGGLGALVAIANMMGLVPDGHALDLESAGRVLFESIGLIFLRKGIG